MYQRLIGILIFICSTLPAFAIIGGERVQEDNLVAQSTVGLSHGCTGTLIAPDIVLTAAHCLLGRMDVEVFFGTRRRGSERIMADSFRIHPDYNPSASGGLTPQEPASEPIHDIAVIKLVSSAPSGFTPVPLSSGQDLSMGDSLILAGYGQTNFLIPGFGRLYSVESIFNFYNQDAFEVVFGPTPGRSACRGDSGGPMFVLENDQLAVIGVTSRGFPELGPCSGNGNYTEVEAHRVWLEETIHEL